MQTVDFGSEVPVRSNLDVQWIQGARRRRRAAEPPLQVHRRDPHTYVLLQSKLLSHEAPFIYLLFGNDKVLLLDTGATKDAHRFPLLETIDALISGWLVDNPRTHYPLVVAHTHGHGDHVAGDAQFASRPNTSVVGRQVAAVRAHFGLVDDRPVSGGDGHAGPSRGSGHHP